MNKNKEIAGIYTIFDRVAETYGDFFQAVNDEVVKRQFMNIFKHNAQVVPVRDLAVVKVGAILPPDDPDDFWPIIANMEEPEFILKGCDIDYGEVCQAAPAACPGDSVQETV